MEFARYRTLGRTGVRVSPICLGTDNYGGATPEDEAIRIINRALDAGINLLDTANAYRSEPIIGKALAENGKRHQVILATKVHHPVGPGPNDRDLSRLHIIQQCERSLRRLQTDYIDLYQLHRCCFHIPVDETLSALTDLVRQGKVRYIGCSTHPAWKVMDALMVSELKGYVRYISEQSPYNLLDRRIENELVPMCQAHGLGILAWSPMAMGILAGRYAGWDGDPENYPAGSRAARVGGIYAERVTPRAVEVGDQFVDLAKECGISPAQLAILWVKDQEGITAPLVGARSVEQLEHILPIMEMDLDDFKSINDRYGHHSGDRFLKEVGRILKSLMRESDVLVRYAGDEFIAVLPKTTIEQARLFSYRLQDAVEAAEIDVGIGKMLQVGISLGLASFPTDGTDLESLLMAADKNMYEHKSRRKGHRRKAGELEPSAHQPSLFGAEEGAGPQVG